MKAMVKAVISMVPRTVFLSAIEGETQTRAVTIKAGLEKPLTLEAGEFTLEGKATYRLEEQEKGRAYLLHITNLPTPEPGFSGTLTLKTNYEERPTLSLRILGRFTKPKPPPPPPGPGTEAK